LQGFEPFQKVGKKWAKWPVFNDFFRISDQANFSTFFKISKNPIFSQKSGQNGQFLIFSAQFLAN